MVDVKPIEHSHCTTVFSWVGHFENDTVWQH